MGKYMASNACSVCCDAALALHGGNAVALEYELIQYTGQIRLMKIAPRTYGDRTQTALTGADGGPIRIAATTIDARQLEPDARDALKQALFAAKRLAEGD